MGAIKLSTTTNFTFCFEDVGSNSSDDVSIFAPIPPANGRILGYYAKKGHGHDTSAVVTVLSGEVTLGEANPPYKAPERLEPIWGYYYKEVWRVILNIVPPQGYVACGSMAAAWGEDTDMPSFSFSKSPAYDFNRAKRKTFDAGDIVCIRVDLCEPVSVTEKIWDDGGSDNDRDVSLWRVPGLNTMVASRSKKSPPEQVWRPRIIPASS